MKHFLLASTLALPMACLALPALGMDTMGEHDMSGKVQKLNHKAGTFELKTGEGVLRLHFPPDSLKEVRNGDSLTVHLGFTRTGSGTPMTMK